MSRTRLSSAAPRRNVSRKFSGGARIFEVFVPAGRLPLVLSFGLALLQGPAAMEMEARAQAAPVESSSQAERSLALGSTALGIRNALEASALVTRQVGEVMMDPYLQSRGLRHRLASLLLSDEQALAGVALYRLDGTLIDSTAREGMQEAVRAPLPASAQALSQGATQGLWLSAPSAPADTEASRRVLLYYAEPIFRRGRIQAAVIGVFTSASLGAMLQRISARSAPGHSVELTLLDTPVERGPQPSALAGLLPEYHLGLVLRSPILPTSVPRAEGRRWPMLSAGMLLLLLAVPGGYVLRRRARAKLLTNKGPDLCGEHPPIQNASVEEAPESSPPPPSLPALIDTQPPPRAQERRVAVSILCISLTGFRSFSQTEPGSNARALFQETTKIVDALVLRHQGVLDRADLDGMIALFGQLKDPNDHAQRALAAAEDILRFVHATAPSWLQTYSFDMRLALGSSAGEAIVCGSPAAPEYYVLGDSIGIAAHLAGLAEAWQLVTTRQVAELSPDLTASELSAPLEQARFGQHAPFKVMQLL